MYFLRFFGKKWRFEPTRIYALQTRGRRFRSKTWNQRPVSRKSHPANKYTKVWQNTQGTIRHNGHFQRSALAEVDRQKEFLCMFTT
jgi:hypothetical protein